MVIRRVVGALSVFAVSAALAACGGEDSGDSSGGASGNGAGKKQVTVYFGGLGAPSADFWRVMKGGADQAAKDLGNVKVVWVYPKSVDIASYTQKLEEAIAAKPEGLVVLAIGDFTKLARKAREKGIKLALSPGPPLSEQLMRPADSPYVSEVGSDEQIGGQRAADYLIDKGAKGIVCIVQSVGDVTLATRCKGAEEEARKRGIQYKLLPATLDRNQTAELVRGFLTKNTGFNAVLATGPDSAIASASAIADTGKKETLLAGFDLGPDVAKLIQSGRMLATIDQQPWWRGYISVLELVHNVRYGLVQPSMFLTGPAVVDKSNIDQVVGLIEQNVR